MKSTGNKNSALPAIALEGEKALKAAVAEIVPEYKKAKKPMVVWCDGKAILISPYKAVSVVHETRATYSAKRK